MITGLVKGFNIPSLTLTTPGDTPVESGEVGHWVASADDRPTTMGDLLQGSADPNR